MYKSLICIILYIYPIDRKSLYWAILLFMKVLQLNISRKMSLANCLAAR